ncbi:MAG TPA: non-ribosomal peptide synthetase [Bryobacteraceae bacterium]|nr:non-ribosomal peptide synthetase [Bryobacteraceae bacterium]
MSNTNIPKNCMMAQIAAQAALNPNSRALVSGKEVMTYAELDARSNRIAGHLRALGIAPEELVGIWLPRCPQMVTGALGVWKAGGAYVPLDPASPAERVAWMLNDAQARVLLTEQDMAERLPRGKWKTIALDREWLQGAFNSDEIIELNVKPEQLAYVIYTSGSTGQPKGVEVTHSSLSNLVSWHQAAFEVTASDKASQLASPGFDAAVWEVWPYLTAGASLHLADDTVRSEPEALRDWMIAQGITIGFVPTPLAERMLALEWPSKTALRVLLTGADALRSYPRPGLPFTLVNNYGPTECTVVSTSGAITAKGSREGAPSIGRPISNVQVYILDAAMQKVPVGVPGEIHIAGAGVARGYVNAPELTNSKFIPNPFDSETGGRLYRTGDLGCFLPDGDIAFRGRIDEQIKIRGYRVEPNEIATALSKHSGIEASTVIARERRIDEKELVAYIVPRAGSTLIERDLREFLSGQLPDYMIPATFVRMDSLPLNASGKVNRAGLPEPDEVNTFRDDSYLAPGTLIEQRISEIVRPLLGVERVSIDDNFFMLGGHSLLGTQLIARTREAFGVEITLRSLFESPSIAALAEEVERLLYARVDAMSEEEAEQSLKGTSL